MYSCTLSLTSTQDGQRHAPAALPRERLGTHCIEYCVGPSARLTGCGISRLQPDPIPGPSRPQRVAIPTELSRSIIIIIITIIYVVKLLGQILTSYKLNSVILDKILLLLLLLLLLSLSSSLLSSSSS